MIGDLAVVEDALVGLDPLALQDLAGKYGVCVRFAQRLQRRLDRVDIVFRQGARIGPRIREHLVLFVQRLGERQRRPRGEAEAPVRLALQARQVVEQRRGLRRWLGLLGDDAGLALALRDDGARGLLDPEPFGARVRIVVRFLEFLVEPAPVVFASGGAERAENFPVTARLERPDLGFAFDQDRQRRGLHAADRRQLKSAGSGIERSHRARAVDADQPVRFGAAHGGVRQRSHRFVAAQLREAVADRRGSHRLQPEALDRVCSCPSTGRCCGK